MHTVNYNYIKITNYCNFNIICGESTGTRRFKTGFYDLTDMPAEFPESNELYIYFSPKYLLLEDIVKVSNRSESEHYNYVNKFLKKINEDNLRINLQKCDFIESEQEWLKYKFTQTSYSHSYRRRSQE